VGPPTCWYDSRLRYQQGTTYSTDNVTNRLCWRLPASSSLASHCRPLGSCTARCSAGRKEKPASRHAVRSARCTARCSAGQKERQLPSMQRAPPGVQPAARLDKRKASQLTATQMPLFRASNSTASQLTNESFARLPRSPVTLIVNICYSGCLQISTSHTRITFIIDSFPLILEYISS
jgi:hypothetical protein